MIKYKLILKKCRKFNSNQINIKGYISLRIHENKQIYQIL